MHTYKDRKIDLTKPIKVYRNLHKNMYSIKQNNRVVGHSFELELRDVEFVVNESGRLKVLETKYKNVHAYLKGYYIKHYRHRYYTNESIAYYNPYTTKTFIDKNTKKSITKADYVFANTNFEIITENAQ